jgi:hypothetical protein
MASKRGKNALTGPWRQDFRDAQALPDIKIVRTNFLFNLIASIFLLIVIGMATYQQYLISVRGQTLAGVERTIRDNAAQDKRNQAESARFVRDIKKVEEAATFADVPVKPEALVAGLAGAQLPQGRYSSLDFQRVTSEKHSLSYSIVLSGTMEPDAVKSAPDLIELLVNKFASDLPQWGKTAHTVELLSTAPDKDMNYFEYSLRLTWSPKPAEAHAQ